MVEFGLEVRADTMEFTVVDTVPGQTDFLALKEEDLLKSRLLLKKLLKKPLIQTHPVESILKVLVLSNWKNIMKSMLNTLLIWAIIRHLSMSR